MKKIIASLFFLAHQQFMVIEIIKSAKSDPLKPETIYGINKLALEKFIQKYSV